MRGSDEGLSEQGWIPLVIQETPPGYIEET